MRVLKKLFRSARRDDGNITVEFVLWFPAIMMILTLIVDATMVLNSYSQVTRVVQDANRSLSAAITPDTTTAENEIEAALANLTDEAVASSSIVDGVIVTSVTFPARDVTASKMFAGLMGITLRVSATHLVENST